MPFNLSLTLPSLFSQCESLLQHHQSGPASPVSSQGPDRFPSPQHPPTIQVTYLPSTSQRSKRPKHFLELKSFKDNYNTLESTLWEVTVGSVRFQFLLVESIGIVFNSNNWNCDGIDHSFAMETTKNIVTDQACSVYTNACGRSHCMYVLLYFHWQ